MKNSIDQANQSFDSLNYKDAISNYEKSLNLAIQNTPNAKEQIANIYLKLGYCLMYENQAERSSENIMNALKIIVEIFGINHKKTADTLTMIGTLNFLCSRFEQAQANFKMARDIYSKIKDVADNELASIYKMEGNIYEKLANPNSAIQSYEFSQSYYEKNLETNIVSVYELARDLAFLYQKKGEYSKSYQKAQRAYDIMSTKLEKDANALALLQERLGENAFEMKDNIKASEHFLIAEKHYSTILPANSVKFAELKMKQDLLK